MKIMDECGRFFKEPKVKKILWGILGIFLIYLAIGSWLHKLHFMEEKIQTSWNTIIQNTQQRAQLLPEFAQLVKENAPQTQVSQLLMHAYQETQNSHSLQELQVSQKDTVVALLAMQKCEANYPALAQNRRYIMTKKELILREQQLDFAAKVLDEQVGYFNRFISAFPQNLLNPLFLHRKPQAPFVPFLANLNAQ